VLDSVVEQFREHSADVWYEKTPAELIPAGTACSKCGGTEFSKENDILDVWFDSGSSHLAVLGHSPELPWPCDLYLEGGDQYRGWFHSSLLVGVGLRGTSPYRECATNGWTLDGEGRAMSKSIGNVIEPEKIIKKVGAEVLRLWVASVEFNEDVRLSDEILARLTEAYRKLRNTFRFALGNLSDFDPEKDALAPSELLEVDQWILFQTEEIVRQSRAWFNDFMFHRTYHAVYSFATSDLSAVYFDICKDRLYTAAPNSKARRSAQTALYRITYALVRLLAPILSFTTDEVWSKLRKGKGDVESVHLALFPEAEELTLGFSEEDRTRAANWQKLMNIREQVMKSLEVARQDKFIGAGLEAKVRIAANGDLYPLLREYASDLPGLFIVSQVDVENSASGEQFAVQVERAQGKKCERCWKYTTDVGTVAEFPTICVPCAEAVREILLTQEAAAT
jgi:isoleucyl-tRNA synthetase